MEAQELVAHVDAVIGRLNGQLTEEDRRCGWNDKCRIAMREFFERLRDDITAGEEVASIPHYVTVGRGLDHWGIGDGELFTQAVTISNMVRKFVPDSSKI